MSDFIKVDDSQIKALQKKLERWVKVAPNEVKKVLLEGGWMVAKEAKTTHFRSYKMPRGVGGPSNAWLMNRTRRLSTSIMPRVTATANGQFSAQVGTNVSYGRKHELGLEGMPERPFLRPSLLKMRPKIFERISKEFMKSYGK